MRSTNLTLGIIILMLFFIAQTANAQTNDTDNDSRFMDWVGKAWQGDYQPYFETSLGAGLPKHLQYRGEFAPYLLIQAQMGYSEVRKYKKYVQGLDDRYLFADFLTTEEEPLEREKNELGMEAIRFGLGQRLGYGYDLGPLSLIPFSQNHMTFTRINSYQPDGLDSSDIKILDRYEDNYRFGISMGGGAKILLLKTLAVNLTYELGVVYPRVIFWPWLGSYAILHTGIGAISYFGEDIVNSSPLIGPIIYFVLKNAVQYGFYCALRENMNWPFESETPLTHESIKIGVSITF